MKRMKLSEDEIAVIEGMRHERAIYNQALTDALVALIQTFGNASLGIQSLEKDPRKFADTLIALRKAD